MRGALLLLAALLVGCATPVEVTGRYASQLSATDREQIQVAVSAERDIDHRIRKLEAVAPDKVKVETGTVVESRWGLTLVKKRGMWMIDKNAGVEGIAERTIVTW